MLSAMARRRLESNPPWVGRALEEIFKTGAMRHVNPDWLPHLASDKPGEWVAREYGCGTYGCVVPTFDPAVVLKITTDDTEAEFARDLSGLVSPDICVQYRLVMMTRARDDKDRKLYLLWRDAAESVGNIRRVLGVPAVAYVAGQYRAGKAAYAAYEHPPTMLRLAREWAARCQAMAVQTMVPELQPLGRGLLDAWTQRGILFGDIHEGNIGRSVVNGAWVITDPGHIAVIDRGDEPELADPGGLPDSADNVLYEARGGDPDERIWVNWNDVSDRLVSREQAWVYLNDMMPEGFHPGTGIDQRRLYAVLRGVPLTGDTIRKNTIYVVHPHQLAERELWGNALRQESMDGIRSEWERGTLKDPTAFGPLLAYVDKNGAIIVEDGNNRLQVAAETDREVAVEFRPVVAGWRSKNDLVEISERVRRALPGTVAS